MNWTRKAVLLQLLKQFAFVGIFVLSGLYTNCVFAQATASIDTAISTAGRWVALADSNQVDQMWSSSSPIMQKSMSKDQWIQFLGSVHNELGPINERQWAQIAHATNPPDLPPGEYVNILFSSRFAKLQVVEKVSLAQAADRWTPVGYVIMKLESAPAAPQK